MEIFIMFFIAWLISSMIIIFYMMFNDKFDDDDVEYTVIALTPILNTLYVLFVVFSYKNIIKWIIVIFKVFKNVIKVFREAYKND